MAESVLVKEVRLKLQRLETSERIQVLDAVK